MVIKVEVYFVEKLDIWWISSYDLYFEICCVWDIVERVEDGVENIFILFVLNFFIFCVEFLVN